MQAIVSFKRDNGTYADVGMNTRLPMTGCKTIKGYLRRAATYKHAYRAEFFNGHLFSGEPFKVLYREAGQS